MLCANWSKQSNLALATTSSKNISKRLRNTLKYIRLTRNCLELHTSALDRSPETIASNKSDLSPSSSSWYPQETLVGIDRVQFSSLMWFIMLVTSVYSDLSHIDIKIADEGFDPSLSGQGPMCFHYTNLRSMPTLIQYPYIIFNQHSHIIFDD